MKSKSEIVFVYNYKDLILITRNRNGEWFYNYSPIKLFRDYQKGKNNFFINSINSMKIGVSFGSRINAILRYCQESYGDKIEEHLNYREDGK